MIEFNTVIELQNKIELIKNTKSVGFVPTMGALHKGHISLIKKAKKQNDFVVVSIFVNPTQFDNKEDLINYPSTIKEDIALLKKYKCDAVFIPSVKEMYGEKLSTKQYDFGGIELEMEGQFREGHFDGVATVVKRLFDIVKPHVAYFGEKDFQQLQIIKKMVAIENLPIKIVGCKIFREKDGLAMSSRNVRLTKEHREGAPFIYKTLKKARKKVGTKNAEEIKKWVEKKFKKNNLFRLEYCIIANEENLKEVLTFEPNKNYRIFIATFANEIRLIDNLALKKM